jgi:hypothetical protein
MSISLQFVRKTAHCCCISQSCEEDALSVVGGRIEPI